jgi:hypothetical protein
LRQGLAVTWGVAGTPMATSAPAAPTVARPQGDRRRGRLGRSRRALSLDPPWELVHRAESLLGAPVRAADHRALRGARHPWPCYGVRGLRRCRPPLRCSPGSWNPLLTRQRGLSGLLDDAGLGGGSDGILAAPKIEDRVRVVPSEVAPPPSSLVGHSSHTQRERLLPTPSSTPVTLG